MSCADVCLDHGYDNDNEFYAESIVTARKVHTCCECSDAITAGARYERSAGKADGVIWVKTTCASCSEIRRAFVCVTWIFGELWTSIEEEMFPIWNERGPIDCLAKLETIEARNKCRQWYDRWRQDQFVDAP